MFTACSYLLGLYHYSLNKYVATLSFNIHSILWLVRVACFTLLFPIKMCSLDRYK